MAADVLRLSCLKSTGGIYSDIDDRYLTPIMWENALVAPDEILVNTPIHRAGEKAELFISNSQFAVQPGNRILQEMSIVIGQKFVDE